MRWKAIIPTSIIIALIVVFNIFFLDGLVECALERTGTALNGAKVELDKVDIRFSDLSVTLKHLQVTDKAEPMTNALEIDSLNFDLAGKPLTWKKFIIEKGEILGVRTATPRKKSGAISKRAQAASEAGEEGSQEPSPAVEKGKQAVSFAMTNLKEQYDPKKLIQAENLASYKKIQEEQAHVTEMAEAWEKRIDSLDVDSKTQSAKSLVERVKSESFSGLEGVKKAKDLMSEADKARQDLQSARNDFNAMRDGVKTEMTRAKDSLRQIETLKKQDLDNSLGQLKQGAFSAEGITRGLIGAEWFGKIHRWLGWIHKARKLLPQKKQTEAPPPPPPRVGREIRFPFRYSWPAFHLKTARVTGSAGEAKTLNYEGTLTDVSSDPKMVGKPIVLEVANQKQQSDTEFQFRGELDYTQDTPRERVSGKYAGVRLAGTTLGNLEAPVTIKDGIGTLRGDVQVTGEQLSGLVRFDAQPVSLDYTLPPEKAGNRLLSILQGVLSGLNQLNVEVALSNTLLQPKLTPRTNLDNAFNDAVKQVLQKELDELKAQFKGRVDELVGEQQQKLASLVESKTGLAQGKLDSKEGALRAVEDQIAKAKEDLKKKAQESIPVPVPGTGGAQPSTEDLKKDIKGIFKKR